MPFGMLRTALTLPSSERKGKSCQEACCKTKVKVVVSLEEQRRVLKACHSEPTSGHCGVTKTYKRMAERVHIFKRKSFGGSIFIKSSSGT